MVADLGIQSFCFRAFSEHKMLIQALRTCGVTHVEMFTGHFDPVRSEDSADVLKTYAEAGITLILRGAREYSPSCDDPGTWWDEKMSATVSQTEFTRLVGEAYEHLYDPVFFRTHPLVGMLVPDPRLAAKERAWRLQRLLLDSIDELDPGPQAPAFSLEVRRYQLMSLHHTDGLDPQTVADRLGISRRHFYREHEAAIEAVAAILWERYEAQPAPAAPPAGEPTDRLELLRLETARLARAGRYARLHDVLPGVLSLLEERLTLHGLATRLDLPDDLPELAADRNLLRQMLLAMLSFLVERARQCTLQLEAVTADGEVCVTVRVEQPECMEATSAAQAEECGAALEDLARLAEAQLLRDKPQPARRKPHTFLQPLECCFTKS